MCGPGSAKGATEQGVTDTGIVMGTVSDPGATVAPGLNQEIFDSADAFVAWCNAAGGINGRKITLNKHDAKLFEVGAAYTQACQTDFMEAGPGAALDAAGVEPRQACGLTQIASYTVSKEAGRAEGSIEALTNNDQTSHLRPILRTIAEKDPAIKDRFALWNNSLPSVIPTGKRTEAAAKLEGFTQKIYEEIPTAVDNWRPFVENLKANDIQVLIDYGSAPTFAPAMKMMADVGYFPKYIVLEGNEYTNQLVQLAGTALDQTTVLVNAMMWPFELAAENPATQQYLDMLKQYAPSSIGPRSLGVNALSAWLLWAVSARDCGSDLTRACVMEKAQAQNEWTGGGLHVPFKPGPTSEPNSECYTVLHPTSKGFSVAKDWVDANQKIYNCDPKNAEKTIND